MRIAVPLDLAERGLVDVCLEVSGGPAVTVALCPRGHGELVRSELPGDEITFGFDVELFFLKTVLCERWAAEPFGVMCKGLLPVVNGAVEVQAHVVRQRLGIGLLRSRRHGGPYRQVLD